MLGQPTERISKWVNIWCDILYFIPNAMTFSLFLFSIATLRRGILQYNSIITMLLKFVYFLRPCREGNLYMYCLHMSAIVSGSYTLCSGASNFVSNFISDNLMYKWNMLEKVLIGVLQTPLLQTVFSNACN